MTQHRRRTRGKRLPAPGRAAFTETPTVDVACPLPCDQRLATLWPSVLLSTRQPGVDGRYFGVHVESDDGVSLGCPRCPYVWQGHERALHALIVGAVARHQHRVHLPG